MSAGRCGPSFAAMGIVEEITQDWHAALAALAWQVDLGVGETVGDVALDRYELGEVARPTPTPEPSVARPAGSALAACANAVAAAEDAASRAGDLEGLRAALAAFAHCDLRQGARNLVFAEGIPGARVLVLGPAPGRDEDQEGRVFAGLAGKLFDTMFAAIGLARDGNAARTGIYACPVLPWRPPSDRAPEAEEIAMMRPFMARHIALAMPRVVVAMGNTASAVLLGEPGSAGIGVGRLRGRWHEAVGLPVLPMFDPAHLMRNPGSKRDAWADLLMLKARLGEFE